MREAYARAWVTLPTDQAKEYGVRTEISIGIEIREGEDVEGMTIAAEMVGRGGLFLFGNNHMELVQHVERRLIRDRFPDRAYFIETEMDGKGVQVYDPRDFAKERCACQKHR